MSLDLLIVDVLAPELIDWLAARHHVRCAPELAVDARALRQALRDARSVVVPPGVVIDAHDLHVATCLRSIGLLHPHADGIDLKACERAGIELVQGEVQAARAEAEFMVGALLAMLRPLPAADKASPRLGHELGGATVGLIGMSRAAKPIAKMLGGFEATLLGYDPAVHASDAVWRRRNIEPAGLRDLLRRADAVCVQLDFFSRYRGLLGQRYLSFCKPGQVMVSIGRSALFDEEALAAALLSGRIAAAWLDHADAGLLDPGRPLAGIASLRVTPQVAGHTRESRLRSEWQMARRIDALLCNDAPAAEGFTPTVPGALPDPAGGPVPP